MKEYVHPEYTWLTKNLNKQPNKPCKWCGDISPERYVEDI